MTTSFKNIVLNIVDKHIDRYSELMKYSSENVDVMFFVFAHNVAVLLFLKGNDAISEEKFNQYSAMNDLSDSDNVFLCGGFLAASLHSYRKHLESEINNTKKESDEHKEKK